MNRRPILRLQPDLQQSFRDCFDRLIRASESYDQGNFNDAMTIASIAYQLVHEGGKRSPSLLAMLGRKSGMRFVDTAHPLNPDNLMPMEHPLAFMQMSATGVELLPQKDGYPLNLQPLPFHRWWENPVLRDDKRREFSRKNLIHFFRHTLGGGHVGKHFESQDQLGSEAFASLPNSYAHAYQINFNDQEQTLKFGPDYVSVRQIGWELEQTLKTACGDLLSLNNASVPNMRPINNS